MILKIAKFYHTWSKNGTSCQKLICFASIYVPFSVFFINLKPPYWTYAVLQYTWCNSEGCTERNDGEVILQGVLVEPGVDFHLGVTMNSYNDYISVVNILLFHRTFIVIQDEKTLVNTVDKIWNRYCSYMVTAKTKNKTFFKNFRTKTKTGG